MIGNVSTSLRIGPMIADPGARAAPKQRPLNTGGPIALMPLDVARDAPALHRASHGTAERERVWIYLGAGPFHNSSGLRDWYRSMEGHEDPLFYTVTVDSVPIGVVSFMSIVPAHGSIEIGHIWYGSQWQRTRVNTTACYLLLKEAIDHLNYRRVEWKCDALNTGSRMAALRLGFRFEGVFRQHRIVAGRNRDTAWFSILDAEWPLIRAGMERWLAWDETQGPRPSLSTLTAAQTTV